MVNRYMVFEVGNSCYTEFRMRNGKFEETCDVVLIDEIFANSKLEAERKIVRKNSDRVFDRLMVRELVD